MRAGSTPRGRLRRLLLIGWLAPGGLAAGCGEVPAQVAAEFEPAADARPNHFRPAAAKAPSPDLAPRREGR